MAKIKRLDLGNLNPIYEREVNKLDVLQVKGRWNVSRDGEGCNGCRHVLSFLLVFIESRHSRNKETGSG